jgi:hypothetical protein
MKYDAGVYRGFMPSYRFFAPAVYSQRQAIIDKIVKDCQYYVQLVASR